MSLDEETFASHDKQIDIEVESTGQRRKLIIALTWPSLAENVFSSLMSMADMIMVGGLGAYAISAVGLVSQPKFILMAAFMAMNVGTTALVAQNKGARNQLGANTAMNQAILLAITLTVVICTTMAILAEPLIRLIAGTELSEQAILEGLAYYKIQIYGFPTMSLTFTINSALRGAGNTKSTFYNNTVANLVNVALNYCLIGGNFGFPRLEVEGASIATVIGQFVGLIMALFVVMQGKQYITLHLKKLFKLDFPMIKRIINIGIPSLAEQVLMRIGSLWFTTIVTALGDISYAAHMVAMNIQQLSFTTGMAFGTAATTLVGQSIGRKRIDLAKVYVRMTQWLGLIVSAAIAVFMFTCGKMISGLYSNDADIIQLSANMLKIIAAVNIFMNARFIYVSGLRGAGDAKFMAVATFIGVVLIRPLVGILLVNQLGWGLTGVWIALSSDFMISYFITLVRYKRGKWTRIEI
ncbi:MAG: MATE family efflux transporter [Oscillospiraceae bacterium]|nr:MATE family efflux transporter [Oscillospiraceae bacterium]